MTRRNFVKLFTALTFLKGTCSVLLGASTNAATVKPVSSSVDLSRLLDCIALVETGSDDTKIGRSGERSKYQINKKVWSQHTSNFTNRNFVLLCKGQTATNIALKHINWLYTHVGPSVYALALSWHVGLENWRNARFGYSHQNYGERVCNLYFNE